MMAMIGKYIELTKPKVTLLNLLVGLTCFILAAYPTVNWVNLAIFCFVGYIAAGGCGVLNSYYDRDIDRLMPRTSKRAIPSESVTPKNALALGAIMIASSIIAAYTYFNALTALMLILGAAFYLYIYTVCLKRITPWNVVIGGFAGCFAAFSGWAAVANTLNWMPMLIALLDFLWTPGHLWGLAIKKVREYRAAGVPMLPVKVGIPYTSKIVFYLNFGTVAFSLLFPLLQLSGVIYIAVALSCGVVFLFQNRGLLASPSEGNGFRVFAASIPYLMCLMLGLIVDKIFLL